ncbi:trigger factor [bacterium]|nr:trigger factor [bacterium]
MDVEITKDKEKSQVTLKISVTPEELEPHLDRAAKALSKNNPPKGFRPGKATTAVAVEAFGKDRLMTEALEKAIPRWFVQAVIEHKIDALGRPTSSVEQASIEEGVTFTATVDVLPAVTLGDLSGIKVEKRAVEITDEQLDKELKVLTKSRSTYLDVARPAEEGDTVTVDFKVMLDGKLMEGGESKNHPVHIGEGHFVPDFEKKLTGITAGDTREFTITFPDDFATKELRGKEATANVKAHTVQKRMIPELNDEFAKSVGKFENLAGLKDQLRENLLADKQQHEHERLHGELTDKLAAAATFDALPQSLVDREIERRVAELSQMLTWQQKSLEQYLTEQDKTMEKLRTELSDPAVKTVQVSLALRQFAQDNDIAVTDQEVETEVKAYMEQHQQTEGSPAIDEDELKTSIANTLRNRKALAQLEAIAGLTSKDSVKAKSS